jgi:hypothetical protein
MRDNGESLLWCTACLLVDMPVCHLALSTAIVSIQAPCALSHVVDRGCAAVVADVECRLPQVQNDQMWFQPSFDLCCLLHGIVEPLVVCMLDLLVRDELDLV